MPRVRASKGKRPRRGRRFLQARTGHVREVIGREGCKHYKAVGLHAEQVGPLRMPPLAAAAARSPWAWIP